MKFQLPNQIKKTNNWPIKTTLANLFIYFSAMTKLLVGGGYVDGYMETDNNEIIDLESASPTTCQNLPNLPVALRGSFGGLGFESKPMICGGRDASEESSNKCYSLEGNKWAPSTGMNTARRHAAVSPSPYPSKVQKFFVTGGIDSETGVNTVEVLTEQGWETLPKPLPVTIFGHCSVLVNSTTVMLIGGFQNNDESSDTYYFNTENEEWTEGPQLMNKRTFHSCGRIRRNSQSQELSIIVAGGYYGSYLSSVEILDLGSDKWEKGPELPYGIDSFQMVEDPKGGVFLVGGSSGKNSYTDDLFQLQHGDADWIKMKQKLKIGRKWHVAFLVPEKFVECS